MATKARERNLSALPEHALSDIHRQSRHACYRSEHRAAFASRNAFTDPAGLLSDENGVI